MSSLAPGSVFNDRLEKVVASGWGWQDAYGHHAVHYFDSLATLL
jgi:hypothetical protein